jgi:replicative DNA helicase
MMKHLSEDEAIDFFFQLAGEERPLDTLTDYLRRIITRLHKNIGMEAPVTFFVGRGISTQALDALQVGYSPSFQWFKEATADVPMDEAVKLEFNQPQMFNNAIIYPQFDGLGRVAGFRSRPFASMQKYLANRKDFPLKKSRLYGLHLVQGTQIVLVEGPNDVLGMKSQGVHNVAALMGNQTKDVEAFLTDRGFSDIVFIGDGDEGGKSAMMESSPLIRVTQIPVEGMDPDQYAAQYKLLGLVQLINQARSPLQIKLESKARNAPSDLSGKIALIKDIAQTITEGLPRIVLLKVQDEIAKMLDVPKEDVSSIFELAEYDTTGYEAKIVSHLVMSGPLAEDIKMKVLPWMFGDMAKRKQFEDVVKGINLSEYISDKGLVTEADVERFVDIAKRRRLKSIMKRSASRIMNLADPLDTSVSETMAKLYDMSFEEVRVISAREQLEIGIHNVMERYKHQDTLLGLSLGTGFPRCNEILQGLRPNTIYVLAASTGTGKSVLGLEWAMDMSYKQKIPVLWISLEMSELDITTRIMSKLTKVSAKRIMSGKLDPAELTKIGSEPIKYMDSPLHIVSTNDMTVSQIVALVRKMKVTHGIKAVFLDYLGLIHGNENISNSYERVGAVAQQIRKGIVMDKNIGLPVVAIAQLHRQAVKAAVPIAEHIADSYKVAGDADVIITIKQRTPEEMKADVGLKRDWGNILMNIDKNRAGEGKQLIGLLFNKSDLSIREVGTTP